jgi:hypothetical protein
MAEQYGQGNINLRDGDPISILTPDAAVVTVLLDLLTDDGQSLAVDLFGGGSTPGAVTTDYYTVITASAMFVRQAGAGAVEPVVSISPAGAFPPTLAFIFVDVPGVGTQCFLEITPAPLSPAYNHRLKISKIRF